MPDSTTDFYRQKTDAELLFFVEHPEQYQPDLVASARRELHRRGVPEAPVAVAPYQPPAYPVPPTRTGLKVAALGLGLLGLAGGTFWLKQRNDAAVAEVRTQAAAARRRPPPRLVEERTSVIPSYDVAAAVARQLRAVPAAEQADAKTMRQFRELAKRFWTAETQTEYLSNQAHAGQAGPVFAEQTLVARQTWQAWNQAVAYGYNFGPELTKQLDDMRQVASSQQHILANFPALLAERRFLTDKEMVARAADVQDRLKDLLPTSPVTGNPYKATVLTIKY